MPKQQRNVAVTGPEDLLLDNSVSDDSYDDEDLPELSNTDAGKHISCS